MSSALLSGAVLKNMLDNGYRNLKLNMQAVDDLNVFPVPDGDTGKNLTMTIEGGVSASVNGTDSVANIMRAVSRGALLSARGNSGVILSQFLRGFAEGVEALAELSPKDFANAMQSGVKSAYRAVLNPVEGTMLTVLREAADFASAGEFNTIEECVAAIVSEMKRSLKRTPDLLSVLKEANVVDSGGAGLLVIFEGMLMELRGQRVKDTDSPLPPASFTLQGYDEDTLLTYGYCTEFVLQLQNSKVNIDTFEISELIANIEPLGDSVVAVKDGNLVKVHIHSFKPERVIEYARTLGEFITVKIENMSVQHSETVSSPKKKKEKYAIVAAAMGSGIIELFKEIGASAVVDGGRTNNPSAGDFIKAFRTLNAEHIIVLPNDSNIILAAEQAAALFEGAEIHILKTKSVAEGYSALSMFDPAHERVEDLLSDMSCYETTVTGYVSVATRNAFIDSVEIKEGEYLGFTNERIFACEENKARALFRMLEKIPGIEEKQVLTLFAGIGANESELAEIEKYIAENLPCAEFGVINGNQEVYDYILSIE